MSDEKNKTPLEALHYHIDEAGKAVLDYYRVLSEFRRLEDLIEDSQNRLLGSVLKAMESDKNV